MTTRETDMHVQPIAWAVAAALALAATAGAAAPAAAQDAEPEPPAAPAAPTDAAPEAPPETPSRPSPESPAEPLVPEKPVSEMTRDEVLQLPPFKRFEIDWEKGEELLSDVKDGTFDYDEAAFYWLVAQVNEIDIPPDLFDPDEDLIPYVQLLSTPSAFRGKPVLVKGVYASVTPWRVPVIALRKDVPRLYTAHLKEFPLRETSLLATVVVIEDPMLRFERGDIVQAVGYFYKVRKYMNERGDVLSSPMLIAKRLEATTRPPEPDAKPSEGIGAAGVMLGVAFGVLVLLFAAFFFVLSMGKRKHNASRGRLPHRIHLRRSDGAEPPAEGGPGGEAPGQEPPGRPDR